MTDQIKQIEGIIIEEIVEARGNPEDYYIGCIRAEILPIQTVGVMGDSKTYYNTVLIDITDKNNRTARIPNRILERISNRITNEVEETNRVVWDITKL